MSEQRLIDANALVDKIMKMPFYTWKDCENVLVEILSASTIDPARHGKWEKPTKKYPYWDWKCSECGCEEYRQRDSKGEYRVMNYCPNCGAKMDKE